MSVTTQNVRQNVELKELMGNVIVVVKVQNNSNVKMKDPVLKFPDATNSPMISENVLIVIARNDQEKKSSHYFVSCTINFNLQIKTFKTLFFILVSYLKIVRYTYIYLSYES